MNRFREFVIAGLLPILGLVAAPSVSAATYYVSPSGNDANNGRSWAAAWRTISKVNASTQSSDTVFFATGVWRGTTLLPVGGRSGAPTVYACSSFATVNGSGAYHFAKIYASTAITGWTNLSGEIYTSSTVVAPDEMLFEGEYALLNNSSSNLNRGEWWTDSSVIRVRLRDGRNPSTTSIERNGTQTNAQTAGAKYAVQLNEEAYVTLWGLEFKYGNNRNISSDNEGDYITIAHCKIGPCGGRGDYNPGNVYTGTTNTHFDNWRITADSIGSSYAFGGNGLVPEWGSGMTFYSQNNLLVDSCVFYGFQTLAALYHKNDNPYDVYNNIYRYNTFTVDNQTPNQSQNFGFPLILMYRNQNNVQIYGNTFINHDGKGVVVMPAKIDDNDSNVFVYNNTFINVGRPFMTCWTESPERKKNAQFKYNVIYNTGTSETNLTSGDLGNPAKPTIIDSNLYFVGNNVFSIGGCNGEDYNTYTLAQWRSLGWDVRSVFTTAANNDFTNVAAGDYSRPSPQLEMNQTYGGRTWTRYGAWQPTGGGCTLPGVPTLVTPANGATNLSQPVPLDWSDISGATSYEVQVDNNSDFSSVLADYIVTTSSAAASGLSGGVTLYWRARAYNGCGWGSWSSTRTFTSICTLPGVPSFVSPASGASNISVPVLLDWSDVAGVTSYQVQVDNNSDFSSANVDQQPVVSSYTASGLSGSTLYYWRTRAQSSCGWGNWSASRNFTTAASETTPPVLTGITVSRITHNMALISWTTNELASTQVNYGATTAYGLTTTFDPTLVSTHAQSLTNLSPLTTYHYRVRSRDAFGNEAVSGDFSFTTTEVLQDVDEGITPTVSSSYSGYTATRITDGVLNPFGGTTTTWASEESSTQPHWIEFDLGSNMVVKRVIVYWAWNSSRAKWMSSQQFRLQAWNGTAYTDVITVSNASEDSSTFVNFPPVQTSRVRYYQSANLGPAAYPEVVWISELDIFGLINTAPLAPQLSSPTEGALVFSLKPTLTIVNAFDNEGNILTYDFQVSTSPSFSSIAAQASGVISVHSGTTSWVVNPALARGTTYYWRGRSFDGMLYSSYTPQRSMFIAADALSYTCGDADRSGAITISDVVKLINYIFSSGAAPNPLLAGDADCSYMVTISDVVYLINFIFSGGQSPCAGCW